MIRLLLIALLLAALALLARGCPTDYPYITIP